LAKYKKKGPQNFFASLFLFDARSRVLLHARRRCRYVFLRAMRSAAGVIQQPACSLQGQATGLFFARG